MDQPKMLQPPKGRLTKAAVSVCTPCVTQAGGAPSGGDSWLLVHLEETTSQTTTERMGALSCTCPKVSEGHGVRHTARQAYTRI